MTGIGERDNLGEVQENIVSILPIGSADCRSADAHAVF